MAHFWLASDKHALNFIRDSGEATYTVHQARQVVRDTIEATGAGGRPGTTTTTRMTTMSHVPLDNGSPV